MASDRFLLYGARLDLRWDDRTDEWVTIREIPVVWYDHDKPGQLAAFYVPAGFRTDLSSIPKIVPRWLFPKLGPQNLPSVVHDWLYEDGVPGITRAEADLMFLDGMAEAYLRTSERLPQVPAWRRRIMYWAVRAFGGPLWGKSP